MLLCIGGISGSGRKTLAREYAARSGYHLYDSNARKSHQYVRSDDGTYDQLTSHPQDDVTWEHLYGVILEDLSLLLKMHSGVVLEDSFHREGPREYFLKEAGERFGGVVFIWIERERTQANDAIVRQHGERSARILRARERTEQDLVPPGASIPVFTYGGTTQAAIRPFVAFVNACR